jgi:hypothetical protein
MLKTDIFDRKKQLQAFEYFFPMLDEAKLLK